MSYSFILFQFGYSVRLPDLFGLWIQSCLPEEKRLSVLLCHVAEAGEQKQQVLLKFSWCRGHDQLPQKVWIIVVHWLGAVITRPLLQDPIGVDNKLSERRVKCCFIPELVQPLHEVSVPLSEMKLIVFIYLPCQRVRAHLPERRKRLWLPSESHKWNVTVSVVFLNEPMMEQVKDETLFRFDLLSVYCKVKKECFSWSVHN